MSAAVPEMILYAGEVDTWSVTVTDNAGAAYDLTGSSLHFTAKQSLTSADTDAVIDVETTSHTNAAGGLSTLAIDLSNVSDRIKSKGATLEGDIWLETSGGEKIPQGLFTVTIKPAATKTF